MNKKHLSSHNVSMEQPFMHHAAQLARQMGVPSTMVAQILYAGRGRELAMALAESAPDRADARLLIAQAQAFRMTNRHRTDFDALVNDIDKGSRAE